MLHAVFLFTGESLMNIAGNRWENGSSRLLMTAATMVDDMGTERVDSQGHFDSYSSALIGGSWPLYRPF